MRVIELTCGVAGPYAAKLLADQGAEVIKLEPPGGDPSRAFGPFPRDEPHVERSGLFLHLKLAAWVIVGLPVAFLGAFMMMPVVGVTINIMSLFAFIVVLGIVVDDAIIIAEAAYTETEEKGSRGGQS